MTKPIKTRLGELHRSMSVLGLTSSDLEFVAIGNGWSRAGLNASGVTKLIRKLKLRIDSEGVSYKTKADNNVELIIRAKGINWSFDCSVDEFAGLKAVAFSSTRPSAHRKAVRPESFAGRATGRSTRYRQSGHAFYRDWEKAVEPEKKPDPASKPEAPKSFYGAKPVAIPQSLFEARRFVLSWPGVSDGVSDRELLKIARRGQILFHPDRAGGDPVLSRAFNAAACFLSKVNQ